MAPPLVKPFQGACNVVFLTGQAWPTTESEAGSSQSYDTTKKNDLFSRTSGDQGTRETPTRRSTSGLIKRDVSLRYNDGLSVRSSQICVSQE